ncbi:hypothetical protein GOL95_32580 [Sinorhizobium medicae]|nr:hypothetical protein [Sinorhizobium medicae]
MPKEKLFDTSQWFALVAESSSFHSPMIPRSTARPASAGKRYLWSLLVVGRLFERPDPEGRAREFGLGPMLMVATRANAGAEKRSA